MPEQPQAPELDVQLVALVREYAAARAKAGPITEEDLQAAFLSGFHRCAYLLCKYDGHPLITPSLLSAAGDTAALKLGFQTIYNPGKQG